MDITSEEDVTMADAKRIMEERKSERDLVYDQKICLDYLEKVSILTEKQTQTVVEELTKIQILKPRYIALILNTLPDTEEEVEALFSKERTNLKKEEVKQIVSVITKFKK
jgi:DNA-directed RNA polymerase subunit F